MGEFLSCLLDRMDSLAIRITKELFKPKWHLEKDAEIKSKIVERLDATVCARYKVFVASTTLLMH